MNKVGREHVRYRPGNLSRFKKERNVAVLGKEATYISTTSKMVVVSAVSAPFVIGKRSESHCFGN